MKERDTKAGVLKRGAIAFLLLPIAAGFLACEGNGWQTRVPDTTAPVTTEPDTTMPVTTVSPRGGAYSAVQYVTLLANEPAVVYYSLDGSDPSPGSSNTLSGPSPRSGVPIGAGTTVLKFFAIDNSGNREAVRSETYSIVITSYRLPDTGQTTSYTATFGEDADYTINAPSCTDNGDGTITDNNTGLLWQKLDDGTARTWDSANSYCAGLSLAGSGWRLPTRSELLMIVDYGRFSPAIDTLYFPNIQSSFYWSTAVTYNSALAWYVNFNHNYSYSDSKTLSFYTRCVRGVQHPFAFTDNGNGTVTDMVTNLLWQQSHDGTVRTWEQSLSYCEGLTLGGITDWRLPNVKELSSIVDSEKYGPAIDTVRFPNTASSFYWSSTADAYSSPAFAWRVNFLTGDVDGYFKTESYSVRCVR